MAIMRTTTVNIAPTWTAILPALLDLLKSKNADARETARIELTRMAQAADEYNKLATVEPEPS